jgi:predicted SprT family Zn-dependent metalloprotease
MQMATALAMARRLIAEHGLEGWTVVADRAKTRAGVCRFATRQIGLSRPLTELHSEAEVRDTILHEIAHALVGPQHGHDRVWRAKAREIGSSGERCVPPEAARVPGDWAGSCPAGHRTTRHKAPTRVLTCARCSRRFDVRHLIRWTFRGAVVPMPETYAAQLRRLIGPAADAPPPAAVTGHDASALDSSAAGAPMPTSAPQGDRGLRVGDLVRVLADGPWSGLVGEAELVGAVRTQVRLDDVLVSFPHALLARAGVGHDGPVERTA